MPQNGDGLHAGAMLDATLDATLLLNIEPDADFHAADDAVAKLAKQEFVVALTPFVSDALLEAADLLLPIGTFAETSGTYVNVEGTWQSFSGVANPVGEARPAWKVLRVLGNLVDADGFDYVTSEDVLAECREQRCGRRRGHRSAFKASGKPTKAERRMTSLPMRSMCHCIRSTVSYGVLRHYSARLRLVGRRVRIKVDARVIHEFR